MGPSQALLLSRTLERGDGMRPSNIVVMPTPRCDRGCAHCSHDSKMEGQEMDFHLIEKIAEEASEAEQNSILFSGGGETSLYSRIFQAVTLFLNSPQNKVSFVTSGCRNGEDTGYENLIRLAGIRDTRVEPCISYTRFNPTSEVRLRFTLPLLREISGMTTILNAIGPELSVSGLGDILDDMGYLPLPDEYLLNSVAACVRCEPALLGSDEMAITGTNDLDMVWVDCFRITPHGRAKKLNVNWPAPFWPCPELYDECYEDFLLVDWNGDIYPCKSYSFNNRAVIGNISTMSLAEARELKAEALTHARKNVLASPKMTNDPCEICSCSLPAGSK